MKFVVTSHYYRALRLTVSLPLLIFTCPSSARPTSTIKSRSPQNLPSPTSAPSKKSDNNTKTTLNYHLLIVAIAGTLFCAAALYVRRRRQRKLNVATQNMAELVRNSTSERRIRSISLAGGDECQPSREREEALEGLNEQGEAPPPYVPGLKPPSLRDVDETPAERTETDSVTPPAYNEDLPTSYSASHEEINISRPIPVVTTERSENTVHSTLTLSGQPL